MVLKIPDNVASRWLTSWRSHWQHAVSLSLTQRHGAGQQPWLSLQIGTQTHSCQSALWFSLRFIIVSASVTLGIIIKYSYELLFLVWTGLWCQNLTQSLAVTLSKRSLGGRWTTKHLQLVTCLKRMRQNLHCHRHMHQGKRTHKKFLKLKSFL